MKRLAPFSLLLIAVIISVPSQAGSKKLPEWIKAAQELPQPPVRKDEKPEAIVIWDEAIYTVKPNGDILETVRYAIRIRNNEGIKQAVASASYDSDSSKAPRMKAWNISKSGKVYAFKRSESVDKAQSRSELHSEMRTLTIDGTRRANVGDVFAYEYTATNSTIFTQYSWSFQGRFPVALSRLEVSFPSDWTIREKLLHGAPAAKKTDTKWTWEMKNLKSVKREPQAPSSSVKRSSLLTTITPPESADIRRTHLAFRTWEDLSRYSARTIDPQSEATPEIVEKTNELIANASTQWEKIQAIGQAAQEIKYISISLNLSEGGGYTPRPASETFRVGYGDCKDKTAFMRSMLDVAGIKSYAVIVNATDNDSVIESYPSPKFFNHCIAAIEVDETVEGPAVIDHPKLGRILFVDPTSHVTPIGELPFDEQGGLVSLSKIGSKDLLRLPLASPTENSESRTITAELFPNGSILGIFDAQLIGNVANAERYSYKRKTEEKYKEHLIETIAAHNPSPRIVVKNVEDAASTDRSFKRTLDFFIEGFSKLIQDRYIVFKPAFISRTTQHPFTKKQRTLPIRLRSRQLREESNFLIPANFTAEDFKESIALETDFGRYEAKIRIEDDVLHYERLFETLDTTLPAERYTELQDFYNAVIEADQTPVVLARSKS